MGDDYKNFLAETGLTQSLVDAIVLNDEDMDRTDLDGLKTDVSTIHGTGLFATRFFLPYELVCMARVKGKRTLAGRYINHAAFPNCRLYRFGGNLGVVAIQGIEPRQELTLNYRQCLDVNKELRESLISP